MDPLLLDNQILEDRATRATKMDLDLGTPPPAISEDRIDGKAVRYDTALAENSPGMEAIRSYLYNGNSADLDQVLLDRKRAEFEQHKISMVNDLIKTAPPEGISDADKQFILGMTMEDYDSVMGANTVLETEYAKKFLANVVRADQYDLYTTAMQEDPENTQAVYDRVEKDTANQQVILRLEEDLELAEKNQSVLGKVWEFGETMIPVLGSAPLRNNVPAAEDTTGTGSDLKATFDYLRSLPTTEEFEKEASRIYFDLKSSNLLLARQFLSGLRSYGSNAQFLDSAFDIIDVVDVALTAGSVGAGVRAGARAIKAGSKVAAFERQLKAASKASGALNPDITKIAREVGNNRVASVTNAVKQLTSKLTGQPAVARNVDVVEERVSSITNPGRFLRDASPNLSKEVEESLLRKMEERGELIQEFLDSPNIQRVLPERLAAVADRLYAQEIENSVRGLKAAVLDIDGKYRIGKDALSNVDYMQVRLGSKTGQAFKSERTAMAAAERYGIKDYTLGDHAGRYTIDVNYNLPETYDLLRNESVPKVSLHNTGFINSVIGGLRSPKHVLSSTDTDARQIVTHGTSRLVDLYAEIAEPIVKLKGENRKRLTQALTYNRDYPHPVTGGDRGHWFENVLEMETFWRERFGALPTEGEIDAYHAYRQLNDLDYTIRTTGWYRDKARLGISEYNVRLTFNSESKVPQVRVHQNADGSSTKVTDPRNKEVVKVSNTKTIKFEGKEVDSIPDFAFNQTHFGVAFAEGNDVQVMYTKFKPNEIRQRITELQAKGYKLIQAADANLRVPGKEKDVGVAYLVVKDFDKSRIGIPDNYRAGPHVINRYPFYAKQSQIVEGNAGRYAGGDSVLFGAPTQQKLNEMVRNWNEAVAKMKAGAPDLEEFVNTKLAMDLKEFQAKFQPRRNAKGETVPGIDPNVPIVAAKSGQRASDVAKLPDDVADLSNNPNNLYTEIDRKFSGERDSANLNIYEQEGDLLVLNDEGELFDPLETLSRSAYSMINLRQKRDYFLKSTNDWVAQFRDLIDAPDGDIARNPSRYVFKEPDQLYLKGADATAVRNAEVARKAIVRFLGQLNREESTLETVKLKVADYAYEKGGEKALRGVEAGWKLPIIQDPASFAKTMAFHTKLGLLNVQQLFVQTQTMANVIAISPMAGFRGASVMPMMRAAQINENMVEWATSLAVKEGWKAEEFKEMMTLLRRSGWDRVRGDQGILDDIANPTIFKSKTGKFLDFAAVFFTEAEKAVRHSAWAAAYLERRSMIKGKALTDADLSWILNRADNMSGNMSAANNAVWQRGLVGIPLQFASWQARITEAYFGKTLTKAEKARLFTMQASLYGLPTAGGGVLGVWPIYESIKAYLTQNNIDYNEGVLQVVVQGLPATLMSAAGIEMDIAARYGTGGVTYLRDLYTGDKSVGEVALGASGSVAMDMLGAGLMPALKSLGSFVNGTPDIYNYSAQNLTDALKNITSLNNAHKLWYALNYQKWLTKNGAVVDNVEAHEAWFMAITGVNLDRIDQTYQKLEILNNRKAAVQDAQDQVRKALQRGMMEDDPKIRQEYMQKAWAIAELGGLLPRERMQILRQVIRGETQVESIQRRLEEDALKRGYN
jgi:hypothetical protein